MTKGLVTVALGIGVTTAGVYLKKRMVRNKMIVDLSTMASSSLVGYGLAHVVLGTIDLCIKDN